MWEVSEDASTTYFQYPVRSARVVQPDRRIS